MTLGPNAFFTSAEADDGLARLFDGGRALPGSRRGCIARTVHAGSSGRLGGEQAHLDGAAARVQVSRRRAPTTRACDARACAASAPISAPKHESGVPRDVDPEPQVAAAQLARAEHPRAVDRRRAARGSPGRRARSARGRATTRAGWSPSSRRASASKRAGRRRGPRARRRPRRSGRGRRRRGRPRPRRPPRRGARRSRRARRASGASASYTEKPAGAARRAPPASRRRAR